MGMSGRGWRSRAGILVALALVVAVCSGPGQTEDLVQSAVDASERGDWTEAFISYREALAGDPDHAVARAGMEEAVTRLMAAVPTLPVSVEVPLLRWLEEQGREADLAVVLSSSTVMIPAGWAAMGSDGDRADERPQRQVYLDDYRIDRYEVTNLEYRAYLSATEQRPPIYWSEASFPEGTITEPVVGVSWQQADSYCAWAGKRLPTEAEWERACRGADGWRYPWGDRWDPSLANVTLVPLDDPDEAWAWLGGDATGPASLGPVGDPVEGSSLFGVCNLAGNASEWVADWYAPDAYSQLPARNPIGDGPPWNHSVRGGAWLFRHDAVEDMADQSRCASRLASHSADDPRVGFRCAVEAP